ncbi:hypothetical protein HYY71_00980 [Candidatus Woesearchaeota archaeon]|nr:hypothetical protein [Candidatus Woesearchaeota archaeon]
MSLKQKSQSWSIDIVLGAIIFMGAFFIFYALLNANPNTKAGSLKEDASAVIGQIGSEEAPLRVVDQDEVNISRLSQLKNFSYDELKRSLRIEGDFCIYFEDEEGNIVLINNSFKGIGSSTINLSGTPCSQR